MQEQDTLLALMNERSQNNSDKIERMENDIMELKTDYVNKTTRLERAEHEINDIKTNQKAIYSIATSVELIAQRMASVENTTNDTNQKLEQQIEAWNETKNALSGQLDMQAETMRKTERSLLERISEAENSDDKKVAGNVNSIKVALITSILSFLVVGLISAVVSFIH